MNTRKIVTRTSITSLIILVLGSIAVWQFYHPWTKSSSHINDALGLISTSSDSDLQPGSVASEYHVLPLDTTVCATVGNRIPEFRLRIRVAQDSTEYETIVAYDIEIRRALDSTFVQSIRDTSRTAMATGVEFVDINFDGFLDLQIVSNLDGAGNRSFHFWTFDSDSNRFRFNDGFSEALGGEMVISPANKQISTGYRVGMGGSSYTYEVIHGRLTLIEHTSEEEVVVNDTMKMKTIIERLVGDTMKVVSEEYELR